MDRLDTLIEQLEKKRGDTSVMEFAKHLGIHGNTYYRIVKGQRGVGPGTLEKILARYPDLGLLFLPGYSPVGDAESPVGNPKEGK